MKMGRIPNFKTDNDIYGKKGEALFESFSAKHGLYIIDVREGKEFQLRDIDYIIIKNPEYTIERILEEDSFTKYDKHEKDWISVEVKTDTRTHDTRNLVYEIISHDNAGCLARSCADFIFYVAVNHDATKIFETWWVKLKEWRRWIRENSYKLNPQKKKDNGVFEENHGKQYLKLNNFNTYGDGCLNFLCNVDELVNQGIATKINVKAYES